MPNIAPTTSGNDANRTYRKMTEEAVAPLVLKLGVPTMLSMLVTALYMTASTYYVSYLGTSAVGAMGVIFALQTIIQAIGIMIGQGCAAQTSRLLGAQGLRSRQYTCLFRSFPLPSFLFVFCVDSLGGIRVAFILDGGDCHHFALREYLRSDHFVGLPFMAASYTLNNLLRSEGLAIVGMMGLGAGGVLNIGVAPIFIFVFDWGIAGAAWANALCQIISFTILLSHYLRGKGSLQIHFSFISKEAAIYFSIFKNGLPSLTRNSLGAVAASVLNLMAGRYGDAGVAAMSIVGQVMMMTNAFLIGLGQGFQPVLGYNWGAKLFDRVKRALDVTIAMGTVLMVALGLLGLFSPLRWWAFLK